MNVYEDRYNRCVGQALGHLAARSGKTQAEIAGFLGVSQSFVSRLERGDASLSVWRLRQLLSLYQVSYGDFFMTVETFFTTANQ